MKTEYGYYKRADGKYGVYMKSDGKTHCYLQSGMWSDRMENARIFEENELDSTVKSIIEQLENSSRRYKKVVEDSSPVEFTPIATI
jgi:hypothetical protein